MMEVVVIVLLIGVGLALLWLSAPPRRPRRVMAVDVETTGLDPEARVIEVGMVLFVDGVEQWAWSSRINPGVPLPEVITDLTGLTDEDLEDAPAFARVAGFIHRRLAAADAVAAHQIDFDGPMLARELARCGLAWPEGDGICTATLAKALREAGRLDGSCGLLPLCQRFGIPLPRHHRALDDARACGLLLQRLEGL